MGSILTVHDLSDDDVDWVLARAEELHMGRRGVLTSRPRVLSLIFLEASLRTRVGYHAAASRLGWQAIDVVERRQSPTSMMESWFDTLRTVAGYSDMIVARPSLPLTHDDVARIAPCPVVNGGDSGPAAQHPS